MRDLFKDGPVLVSAPGGADTTGMQSANYRGRIVVTAILLSLSGCHPAVAPNNTNSKFPGPVGVNQGPTGPIDTDACAARLHDIIGQLYDYYLTNHRFPDRLEELSKYVDFDQVPDYRCPVSHLPYTYAPNGLESVNQSGRLIVFDSSPVHQNARWCIVVTPSPRGQQAMTMDVKRIPEGLFQTYQPVHVVAPLAPASAPAERGR